jgi:spore coat protein U-like protein
MRTRLVNFAGLVRAIVVAGAIGCATPAHAGLNCTFSITNLNFGNIDLTANTAFDTTGTLTANCTGGGAGKVVRICPNINAGSGGTITGNPRFLLNGTTKLNFNLYQDAARTTVWGSYLWSFSSFTAPTINLTLGTGGTGSTTATIFGRVSAGQQTLAPGTYTSSFSGTNTQIAYDITTDNCATIGTKNATSAAFTVTATYPATCSVAAATLNFSSQGVLTANVDASSTLTATCSSTTAYTVALNGGNAGASDPTQRKMSKASEQITYGLYRDSARSQVWGSTTGTNTASGTGSGLGQSFTVFGRVPAQTTPSPGTYLDTIVATLTF